MIICHIRTLICKTHLPVYLICCSWLPWLVRKMWSSPGKENGTQRICWACSRSRSLESVWQGFKCRISNSEARTMASREIQWPCLARHPCSGQKDSDLTKATSPLAPHGLLIGSGTCQALSYFRAMVTVAPSARISFLSNAWFLLNF